MKKLSFRHSFSFILLSMVMMISSLPIQVLSNENNQGGLFRGRGRPSNVTGGGNRGNCEVTAENANLRLTALVPAQNAGVTRRGLPNWWFYSPYTQRVDSPIKAKFNLLTEDDQNFLEPIEFDLPETPGFFPVFIPPEFSELSLKEGELYIWHLSVICTPNDESKNIVIRGWIERLPESVDLESHLIWYDTIDALAQDRCNNPHDLEKLQQWQEVLSSVDDQLEDTHRLQIWKAVRDQPMDCPLSSLEAGGG